MATDLFDQLATAEVPPLPPQFERRVHDRLNRVLLVQQLTDFVVGAFPWLVVHLAHAAWALVRYTVLGQYPAREDDPQQQK